MENHLNQKMEESRVQYVLNEVEQQMENLLVNQGGIRNEVIELRKTFWEDVTVNFENLDEAIETMSSIKQQSEMLSERERSHGIIQKRLLVLKKLQESPYFGRIDFLENNEMNVKKIYIGVATLLDAQNENILVYDWRSKIASMYYEYSLGKASYETAESTIEGELTLKRQFVIKNGKIKSMFDTSITIGDEMLKEVLGTNASTTMKNIVSTIQKEQNQIIRHTKSKYVIVQGVAGSGKTSVALQRIAFLLYQYKNEITSKNILLFSPNALFSSYISTVLPDLGEEDVEQLTFQEYLEGRIGKSYRIETAFQQLESLLLIENSKEYMQKINMIQFKSSTIFQEVLDTYLTTLSDRGLQFKNISFRSERIIHSNEIYNYFYSLPKNYSISNRMQLTKKWLLRKLELIALEEEEKDWVYEEMDLLDNEEYVRVYHHLQNNNGYTENTFDDFDREQKIHAKNIVSKAMKPLRKAIADLHFVNLTGIYRQVFSQEFLKIAKKYLNEALNNDALIKESQKVLKNKVMRFEDAAPFLYLKDKIEGQKVNTMIRHLFIDEAQDYSPMQVAVIKNLFPNCRMTILGDNNQTIFPHSLGNATALSERLYQEEQTTKMVLTTSYRSTAPIISFVNEIVTNQTNIFAFQREGITPTIAKVKNDGNHKETIYRLIDELKERNNETIAIICKTLKEANEAYETLKYIKGIQLISQATYSYKKGVLIIPSYYAKGIEFDAVIIYNASRNNYDSELDGTIFYTICTRAMHELHLVVNGEMSSFIKNVPRNCYRLTFE